MQSLNVCTAFAEKFGVSISLPNSTSIITHSIQLPRCDLNGVVLENFNRDSPLPPLRAKGTLKGNQILKDLPRWGLGIVGTRKCTASARDQIYHLLRPFAGSPLIVVSGFARGVDRHAHEIALKLDLRTVAILGSGLEICYPPEHHRLRDSILENHGLLLSPFQDFESPRPFYFLKRNQLIAELSHTVWIVEAPYKSGAMNTAAHASNLERRILVTPAHPRNPHFSGNIALLNSGRADPLWLPQDLFAHFPNLPLHSDSPPPASTSRHISPSHFRPRLIENTSTNPYEIPAKIGSILTYLSSISDHQSGATLTALQEWWISQGWTHSEFFETLQEALRNKWIVKECGVFLKNES